MGGSHSGPSPTGDASRENEKSLPSSPPHTFNRDAQSKCPLSEEQPSPAPTQVIMTNTSLPVSPKQMDVGGFAFAFAGTPPS